jgi:hypothetical protein
MKITAKISHLIWGGFWSISLLLMSLSEMASYSSWRFVLTEWQIIVLPILALGWLAFSVGLLFDQPWAWYGSFVYSVISLFVAFYILWADIPIIQDVWKYEVGAFCCEVIGAVSAVTVVWLLLHSRHRFLKKHEPAT